MSDLNEWLKERRAIHNAATGGWERDEEDCGCFWTDGGRSDFHLTPEDARSAVDAHNTLPALLTAVEKVLELHTRIVTDQHVNGPTAVCEQCSEDRMFALWPCETVEAIEGAIKA